VNKDYQKHAFTNQTKCTRPITQKKHKRLKPGLVASYDIRPGNGEGLFWFQCFINLSLTYLLTYRHLPTYSQRRDPHGAPCSLGQWSVVSSAMRTGCKLHYQSAVPVSIYAVWFP